MDVSTTPCDPNAGFTITLPLPSHPLPMNVALRDDQSFNMPMLNKLTQRHAWRKFLPTDYLSNAWILGIDDEEPITASGEIDALNFIRKNKRHSCFIQFHKRTTYSGTLLNDYRSVFNQFERPHPTKIIKI